MQVFCIVFLKHIQILWEISFLFYFKCVRSYCTFFSVFYHRRIFTNWVSKFLCLFIFLELLLFAQLTRNCFVFKLLQQIGLFCLHVYDRFKSLLVFDNALGRSFNDFTLLFSRTQCVPIHLFIEKIFICVVDFGCLFEYYFMYVVLVII